MSSINYPYQKSTGGRWLIVFLLLLIGAVALVTWLAWPFGSQGQNGLIKQPQAVWQAQNIDSYRYTLSLYCFCPPEVNQQVIIEVQNGELSSLTYAASGESANISFFDGYTSIERLHAIIADAEAQKPARLEAAFDPATGVPLEVDIDISEMMADEEIRFTVTDFEQLP